MLSIYIAEFQVRVSGRGAMIQFFASKNCTVNGRKKKIKTRGETKRSAYEYYIERTAKTIFLLDCDNYIIITRKTKHTWAK